METQTSTIGDHAELVLDLYQQGFKQSEILRRIERLGVKTTRQNLSVWIARRLARIQQRSAVMATLPPTAPAPVAAPVATMTREAPRHEPVRQVKTQPAPTPQKVDAAPSAVPAAGATHTEKSDTPVLNSIGTGSPQRDDLLKKLEALAPRSASSEPDWMATDGSGIFKNGGAAA